MPKVSYTFIINIQKDLEIFIETIRIFIWNIGMVFVINSYAKLEMQKINTEELQVTKRDNNHQFSLIKTTQEK